MSGDLAKRAYEMDLNIAWRYEVGVIFVNMIAYDEIKVKGQVIPLIKALPSLLVLTNCCVALYKKHTT